MSPRHRKYKAPNLKQGLVLACLSIGFFGSGALFLWAATLQIPDLSTFDERKINESTKIYDRTGEILLYDVHENVKRTVVPFDAISRNVKNATVAIEDSEFYQHHGVRPLAFLRALLVNLSHFEFSQGGSTITQQVVKNTILTQDKTIARKLKEWILAIKLERVASKDKILDLYLNEAAYGGNIYGIEEATQAFFGKSAKDLTLAESAYIAALPQAPTFYSPYGNNKEKLDTRKNLVLQRMRELGFISEEEFKTAQTEKVSFLPPETRGIRAPHFVFYVIDQLEKKFGKDVLETGGLKVITTLDFAMQQKAEETVNQFADENVQKFNAHNMGLVAIDPKTGQILAMVGSKNYFDNKNDGNFNVTLAKRQPGSAFKPFVYATAFAKGYTPETTVFDVETQFNASCDASGKPLDDRTKPEECYKPQNYDEVFRGPVSLRNALAQSINIPAIKVLYLVGIKNALETARNVGITSLTDPDRYGLTLVLGGGEVSLLELTSAYSVFANEGVRNQSMPILKALGSEGNTLLEFKPSEARVMDGNIALQISDILSDNVARAPAFGERSFLYIENRDVAVKTGTTNDYRDAWVIGYTPNLTVGMWAGNNDNTPMEKKVAGFIIAPVWNAFMNKVLPDMPHESFRAPEKDPALASLKPILRGMWTGGDSYFIDKVSQKLATAFTPKETLEERFIPNIHSELYWINKNDPRGPAPDHPEEDSQYNLWEGAVQKWAKTQNVQNSIGVKKPTEYDPIHSPEIAPLISIKNWNNAQVFSPSQHITLQIEGSGKYGLTGVDLYINNIYIGETTQKPFLFSFIPDNLSTMERENTIRVEGYDSIFNRRAIEAKLLLDK